MTGLKKKRASSLVDYSAHRASLSTFYAFNDNTKGSLIQFDYAVSSWQELGTQAFFAGLAGMLLSVAVYLGVCFL